MMNRVNLTDIFIAPESYRPPDDSELRTNTAYPNLNSREYRKKPGDHTMRIQPFLETLTLNSIGHAVLSCNDYKGRIWNGSFWGFESVEAVGKIEKAVFKLQCLSPITNIKFIDSNIVLVSEANGTVQVWSTASEVRSDSKYCLFSIGAQHEHTGMVTAMDIFKPSNTQAITGANDACLKIWDTGAGNLVSTHTFRDAHSGSITGISSQMNSDSVFVTCSRDKSVLQWDIRERRPAICLKNAHKTPFTSVYWTTMEENQNMIMLGDEAGFINQLDDRMPNHFVVEKRVYDRPCTGIRFNGKQMAVIGLTNQAKIFSLKGELKEIFCNTDANDYVRDVCWTGQDSIVTTSWDGQLRTYNLSSEL